MAHEYNHSTQETRQEDGNEFGANLDYTVSSRLACATGLASEGTEKSEFNEVICYHDNAPEEQNGKFIPIDFSCGCTFSIQHCGHEKLVQ